MSHLHTSTRRALLKKMAALPLASAATPMALQLLGMANAAAQSANDYKALVCVFLFGANDHYNTVVPYDSTNYNAYYNVRKGTAVAGTPYEGIALTRSSLDNTVLGSAGLPSGMQMALGPTMTGMKTLFDAGKLGVLLNVGPLLVPTTLAQYNNKSVPLPPKLFSHNDQQAYWHTGGQAEGGTSGWGGRTADLILSDNSKAALSCVSVNGNAVYLSGKNALSYQISSSGASTINALRAIDGLYKSTAAAAALKQIVTQNSAHWLEHEHAQVMNRALGTYDDVFGAIGSAPSDALKERFLSANPPTGTTANSLSQQLQMVARLMEKRESLGIKRQVFFVGLGGFDLHDFLANQHPGLLDRVSKAMAEFNDALEYLGLSQQVTTFTGSDFGRTLASNGDGSDHGWGSHQFIMGGAVNGGRFYGSAPPIGVTHTQQVGSGRLLPSTATEQMSAELARWFGVSNADMPDVLPNARYFDLHRLGMLRNV
jgi:uncharacterized protein (DUF1501 family)